MLGRTLIIRYGGQGQYQNIRWLAENSSNCAFVMTYGRCLQSLSYWVDRNYQGLCPLCRLSRGRRNAGRNELTS